MRVLMRTRRDTYDACRAKVVGQTFPTASKRVLCTLSIPVGGPCTTTNTHFLALHITFSNPMTASRMIWKTRVSWPDAETNMQGAQGPHILKLPTILLSRRGDDDTMSTLARPTLIMKHSRQCLVL